MAPIKIKLSLSSASLANSSQQSTPGKSSSKENGTSTPKHGKASQHAQSGSRSHDTMDNESHAGPSRLPDTTPLTPASAKTPVARSSRTPVDSSATSVDSFARGPRASKASSSSTKSKGKAKAKSHKRPSAIPTRLLSSTPSTPKSFLPLPDTDTASPSSVSGIKEEDEDDDGDEEIVGSPAPGDSQMDTPEHGYGANGENGTPTTGSKNSAKLMRLRKPLREHATKIVVDLLRRDEYDLFGQPVDLESYPDYLGIVGGEDKMMDLGTMQNKIDNEEYRSIEEFQADLDMLATAAKTFNPVGTVPHNAAIKIHAQGSRQIDRIRDLVITPAPSRAGSAPWRDGSVMSGRGMTAAPDGDQTPQKVEVPPLSYVPAEMLSYPPHSGPGKMVGWNLNGGKRVYLKKITRGREKFTGKWRHWDLDGSRDVAEMDEPDMLFAMEKTRTGTRQRSIVDWKQMRRETWWEYEGIGGPNGQPPLAGTPFPKRPIVRERPLTATDWGVYPDIDNEMTAAVARYGVYDETAALYSHLNASRLKPLPTVPHNFVNIFEDAQRRQPVDYLREVATGDITGEAYTRSVDRFIQGAIAGRKTQRKPTENSIELSEYVNEHFAYGVLSPDFEQRKVIRSTLANLRHIAEASSSGSDKAQPPPQSIDSKKLMSLAQASYGRTALRHLTAHANSLDIVPLIRSPAEFTWQGIGAKGDIEIGLRWVSQRIKAASDLLLESRKRKRSASPSGPDAKRSRIEDIPSSPLTAVSSPIKDPQAPAAGIMSPTTFDSVLDPTDGEGGMKRVRLELLALTKFYPLAALRKMDKASAEQLLPTNVRALMTKPA